MRVGSLFSGIGGLDLGLERAGMTVVWQVEANPWCRKILRQHWPDVPCYEDIKVLTGEELAPIDVLVGGFPCQPVSVAGAQKGTDDDRWLWPEFNRLIRVLRPRYALLENVPGLFTVSGGHIFGEVIGDLAAGGYDAEWDCLSAASVGAPHLRYRVFIIASNPEYYGSPWRGEDEHQRERQEVGGHQQSGGDGGDRTVADAQRAGRHPSTQGAGGVSQQPRGSCGPLAYPDWPRILERGVLQDAGAEDGQSGGVCPDVTVAGRRGETLGPDPGDPCLTTAAEPLADARHAGVHERLSHQETEREGRHAGGVLPDGRPEGQSEGEGGALADPVGITDRPCGHEGESAGAGGAEDTTSDVPDPDRRRSRVRSRGTTARGQRRQSAHPSEPAVLRSADRTSHAEGDLAGGADVPDAHRHGCDEPDDSRGTLRAPGQEEGRQSEPSRAAQAPHRGRAGAGTHALADADRAGFREQSLPLSVEAELGPSQRRRDEAGELPDPDRLGPQQKPDDDGARPGQPDLARGGQRDFTRGREAVLPERERGDTRRIFGVRPTGEWAPDPSLNHPESLCYVGRVAHGIPKRMDRVNRLKGLGNAVVPQVAQFLGERILLCDAQRGR